MAKSYENILKDCDFEQAFHWFNIAKKLDTKAKWFAACAQIAEWEPVYSKTYILDANSFTIIEKVSLPRAKRTFDINTQDLDLLDDVSEKCYLFRFFDAEGARLCSKVGTTTRPILKRLKEELSSKTYQQMGAVSAVIDRVYDCHGFPAEGLESYFRAEYIKQFPNSFKKNDRFLMEDFDLDEADEIVKRYFEGVV